MGFHFKTVNVLSLDTASGGNVTCAATCLRSQWVPCLDRVSLRKTKQSVAACSWDLSEGKLFSLQQVSPLEIIITFSEKIFLLPVSNEKKLL